MTVALSEYSGSPVPDEVPTLWALYRKLVDENPHDLAIVSMHQAANLYGVENVDLDDEKYNKNPYLRWTYRSFAAAVDQMASELQNLGVKEGMPIVSFLANGAERLIISMAADQIGCIFTAISVRNFTNMEEVNHMMGLCKTNARVDGVVYLVQDSSLVKYVDSFEPSDITIKILVNGEAQGWKTFKEMMTKKKKKNSVMNGHTEHVKKSVAQDESVFFTSGTTKMPKGCRWVHPQLGSAMYAKDSIPGFRHGDKWACVMPNNFVYCHAIIMFALCGGTTVVFPGETFEPHIMFSALTLEKVTHVSLVPTMVLQLIATKEAAGVELPHLKGIMVGGAVVSPLAIKQILEGLGADTFENAYGMTDGVFITSGSQSDPNIYIDGEDVAVGKALPGSSLKISALDDIKAIPRNAIGELHYSGMLNCAGYVGVGYTDDWYVDEGGRRWFKTGDQARMDEQGRVFVIGRYKDMIIRGGKNLACTAMEANINKIPKLVQYKVQIVPVPDDIAGEVPVAVTELNVSQDIASEIQETLRKSMGREYVPDEVLCAEDLGFGKTFPMTMSGKVKKQVIAKAASDFRARRDSGFEQSSPQMGEQVRDMWARAAGLTSQDLTNDTDLADFADSITIMRVRDRMTKATGRKLAINEIAEAGTIGNVIKALDKKSPEEPEAAKFQPAKKRSGPPMIDDMIHLVEDPDLFDATKELVAKTIGPTGFQWEDVQDVIPAYDFGVTMSKTHIYDSWNWKFAMMPSKKMDKRTLRRAIEAVFKINPILSSFLVWDDQALGEDLGLHVTLHHSPKLMDAVIDDVGSVETMQDLHRVPSSYPNPKHGFFPGPLTRFLIYEIEVTHSCGFVFNVNHSIIDASYGQIIQDDLERALGNPDDPDSALLSHPDYKLWADSYFTLRNSPEARRAVKWHVNRLKNLESHHRALTWPGLPTRVPYDDSRYSGPDAVAHEFDATGVREFRKKYSDVTLPVFVKAALALLNTAKTGHTHALFSNLEAARTTFPFVTRAQIESGQYEATEVAGPCFESVLNLVEIKPEETNAAFLHRMQEDQTNLTKYASAPWTLIMEALGSAGHMLPDVTQAQIYNWVPGQGTTGTNPFKNFEVINAVVRPQVGLALNTGMGGNTMFLQARSDTLGNEELQRLVREVEVITKWMVEKENWNKPCWGFVDELRRVDA